MNSPEFFVDPSAPEQPDQYKIEFTAALGIFKALAPRSAIEIGVREGGSLYQWMKHSHNYCKFLAIDLPGKGRWGTDRTINAFSWKGWARKLNVWLDVALGDSAHPATIKLAKDFCRLTPDFVFIDGDHSEAGVWADWENFGKQTVEAGGIVMFHDIVGYRADPKIEVYKVWEGLKREHDTLELFSTANQKSRGIGVVYGNLRV